MSRKLQLTIPDPTAEKLAQLAHVADQPLSRLAAQLLQRTVDFQARRSAPPSAPAPSATGATAWQGDIVERPPWLPPYEDADAWRALTWGAIAALHARYQHQLQHLKQDWWNDTALLEKLSALAYWREQLDDHAADPREELYFHETLDRLANELARRPGRTSRWDSSNIPARRQQRRSSVGESPCA
jgi:hypothetical protein